MRLIDAVTTAPDETEVDEVEISPWVILGRIIEEFQTNWLIHQ